jgi:hypothetical protein
MVIVKATKDSENEGAPPDPQLMADMNKFNDELLEAGVLLGYDGLHPFSWKELAASPSQQIVSQRRDRRGLCRSGTEDYRAPCFSFASKRSVIEENLRLVAHTSASSLALLPFARNLANSLNCVEDPYLCLPVSR